LAEFDSPGACAQAIHQLRDGGCQEFDVYMPYATREIDEALALEPSILPRIVFIAGCLGAAIAYFILWYTNVYDYPLNVGGRPSHAVPAFIPITFETAVLAAGCSAFVGGLLLGGLPRLYHPVDELDAFDAVSVDRFAIAISTTGTHSDPDRVMGVLCDTGALAVRQFGVAADTNSASDLQSKWEIRHDH
jgi:hypothetical protein